MLDSKEIGQRIRKYRKEKKLTQKNLAKLLGVVESTIQKYEYGTVHSIPSPVLNQLADLLDVSVWDLLGTSKEDAYSQMSSHAKKMGEYEYYDKRDREKQLYLVVTADKIKGEKIKYVQKRLHDLSMSYDELASKTGLPLSSLKNPHYYDDPELTLDDLRALSKALNVSLDYLMGFECIDLPKSYYKSIMELTQECGATINFNKETNNFEINYKDISTTCDYKAIKQLKDEILTYTKFRLEEMLKL